MAIVYHLPLCVRDFLYKKAMKCWAALNISLGKVVLVGAFNCVIFDSTPIRFNPWYSYLNVWLNFPFFVHKSIIISAVVSFLKI
jgi:hypothetical protein